jgi:hypothetical protein
MGDVMFSAETFSAKLKGEGRALLGSTVFVRLSRKGHVSFKPSDADSLIFG